MEKGRTLAVGSSIRRGTDDGVHALYEIKARSKVAEQTAKILKATQYEVQHVRPTLRYSVGGWSAQNAFRILSLVGLGTSAYVIYTGHEQTELITAIELKIRSVNPQDTEDIKLTKVEIVGMLREYWNARTGGAAPLASDVVIFGMIESILADNSRK